MLKYFSFKNIVVFLQKILKLMNMNQLSIILDLHIHGIDYLSSVDYPSKSKVRIRVDGDCIHTIINLNALVKFLGYPLAKRLFLAYISSGLVTYRRKLRRGVKIEIFEI